MDELLNSAEFPNSAEFLNILPNNFDEGNWEIGILDFPEFGVQGESLATGAIGKLASRPISQLPQWPTGQLLGRKRGRGGHSRTLANLQFEKQLLQGVSIGFKKQLPSKLKLLT